MSGFDKPLKEIRIYRPSVGLNVTLPATFVLKFLPPLVYSIITGVLLPSLHCGVPAPQKLIGPEAKPLKSLVLAIASLTAFLSAARSPEKFTFSKLFLKCLINLAFERSHDLALHRICFLPF